MLRLTKLTPIEPQKVTQGNTSTKIGSKYTKRKIWNVVINDIIIEKQQKEEIPR